VQEAQLAEKLPWFQFFARDWRTNMKLRRCSLAARGLWVEMLCMMHECEERGMLISAGQPWLDHEVAAAVGGDHSANLLLLRELLDKGVCKRDGRGTLYSSRMTRDESRRFKCSEAGKRGGGNPNLQRFKGESKGVPKVVPKETTKDASVSGCCSSVSLSDNNGESNKTRGRAREEPDVCAQISDEMYSIFVEWNGRIPGSVQIVELAHRVEKYGEPLVSKAMVLHLKNGTAKGNWRYLDKIIEGGAVEKKSGTIAGIDMDAILGKKK
jgi:hypothetical protein